MLGHSILYTTSCRHERGFVNQLRNTYKFFADYAEDWSPGRSPAPAERALVDRWLLSRLDATIEAVHAAWNGYDPTAGVRTLMGFVDELSNWYVRVNRPRFWAVDAVADSAALATLHEALVAVSRGPLRAERSCASQEPGQSGCRGESAGTPDTGGIVL